MSKSIKHTVVGARIIALRKREKLTQKELGELLEVDASTVSNYERGNIKKLDMDILREIASLFMVNLDWLLYCQ